MKDNREPSEKQKEIIEAALDLLSEKGYNELSLRDIAKRLGVQAPAIYWHFKNKAMLVDYMADHILRKNMGAFVPRESEQSWQDWLIDHIVLFRKALLSYPDGGRMVGDARPLFPGTLVKFMDVSIASLCSADMDIRTAKTVLLTAIRYTFGSVIEEQSLRTNWETIPEHTKNTGEFTNIMQAVDAGGTDDENFMAGLKLIVIAGSEAIKLDKSH